MDFQEIVLRQPEIQIYMYAPVLNGQRNLVQLIGIHYESKTGLQIVAVWEYFTPMSDSHNTV
jgi:hypothetical protein